MTRRGRSKAGVAGVAGTLSASRLPLRSRGARDILPILGAGVIGYAVILLVCATSARVASAQSGQATASSEIGPGYGAMAVADSIAHENGNYWHPIKGQDDGAWWQLDLRQVFALEGVEVVWARYEDKYHCPPARLVIQASLTGEPGSWKDVRSVARDEIPRDGDPYDVQRQWQYKLAKVTATRYVRLFFPDGDQTGARHDGYIAVGEVEMLGSRSDAPVIIEGRFGRAELNTTAPALESLFLRGPNGELDRQSMLSRQPVTAYGYGRGTANRPWATNSYTYVVGEDGSRYESRITSAGEVEVTTEGGRQTVRIAGVKLSAGTGEGVVAMEDWTLSAPGDGSQLVWQIVRRWKKDFVCVMSGSPGLFLGFDPRHTENSVTSTLWYDPFRIAARWSDIYAINMHAPQSVSPNLVQTIRDPDTWAIYKLWTNYHARADPRLEVEGGHLYRRGSFAYLGEVGAVTGPGVTHGHKAGDMETITLKLSSVDKYATGYQLAVTLPDKETEANLKSFYTSVFNGGAVNDQKGFDFGNESDGWYYGGSCWMYGMTLAAGTPAAGQLSSHPYDAARAFREHLAHVLSTLGDGERTRFGYNQSGQWVDDNLHTIIGTHAYLLHSGDVAFARQNLPALERMLGYFVQRRNDRGLFKLDDVGAHWYYDWVIIGGVNTYYNAFFYKAATDLAEMEAAAGFAEKARKYRALAESIKVAFNDVFWKEDAPGGPRYIDWIDSNGADVTYFADICQWPPVAVGIASPEQGRKIVATADARIRELVEEYGYTEVAGLSALWPVPLEYRGFNPAGMPFGVYMNGGSLLAQTYWEVVGRARAGDGEGAYRRLKLFARHAAQTSFVGNNHVGIRGGLSDVHGGQGPDLEAGEPYLADMVTATAAMVHGVLGITPNWNELEVTPQLPEDWPHAGADILYKGRRHRITIENGTVHIEPLEQVIDVPLLWVMDFNLKTIPDGVANISNAEFVGHYSDSVRLKATPEGLAKTGSYQSPDYDWTCPAKLDELTVSVQLNGGQVTATVETSDDGFKTIRSDILIRIGNGVNVYPLDELKGAARAVRVRFDLAVDKDGNATPVIDAFRVSGQPADLAIGSTE